ncbi:MAG TPA: sulfatase-like hydrolase/transferase [Verrucomicrobiae bacterium]
MKLFSIFSAVMLCLLAVSTAIHAAEAKKPNVILIMADDLGYETIGANGGTSYPTPHLDKLAKEGVRFTQCYVQPLCTPTRVQLMTGKYNIRNYSTFGQMDPKAVTFGNLFKQAGYATTIAGKWQLGQDPELPKKYGFEEHCLWQHTHRPPRYANPGLEINGVKKDYSNGEYGPDEVNRYVLDFIARKKDAPFFVYYPLMLTHSPYQPTPDSKDWDPKAIGENVNKNEKHFGEMVTYMDKLIGQIIAQLDKQGLRENTLVIFLGDNGTGSGTKSMMGSKVVIGGKGKTTDAGMHVPLIVNWPAKAAKGKVSDDLVDSTDFLPTICDAAGIKLSKDFVTDGRNFLPQVRGEKGQPREWVYSWYAPYAENLREMAFTSRYKLYRNGNFYDLTKDLEEKNPLKVSDLTGDAASSAKLLQGALAKYEKARPASLPQPGADTGEGKKAKKKKKQDE